MKPAPSPGEGEMMIASGYDARGKATAFDDGALPMITWEFDFDCDSGEKW